MPSRPCIGRHANGTLCGVLVDDGSYCEAHERPAWAQRSPSSKATARPGWNNLRARAMLRDGSQCVRCGATTRLTVHHRVPVAEGGTMALDNLTVLCERCHGHVHAAGGKSSTSSR